MFYLPSKTLYSAFKLKFRPFSVEKASLFVTQKICLSKQTFQSDINFQHKIHRRQGHAMGCL